ncbi:MAG TPA: PilN domain-containing protein [Polyangia bacterium]|jgi:type IV pilus assembly protein PilN
MIRINLLPVKAAKKREAGQRQVVLLLLAVIGAFGIIVGVHLYKTAEVDRLKKRNADMSARLAKLKSEIGDYDVIKAQYDELTRQKQTIDRLKSGRTGPVGVMRELSDIISKGKGPRLNVADYEVLLKKDPNAGYNPTWDPRRLWITSYTETNRRVKLVGGAKSYDDVAEFMKRMQLSVYFSEVQIHPIRAAFDAKNGVKHVVFEMTAAANY